MRIALDLDDVVFDFTRHWMDLYSQWWGSWVHLDHWEEWDALQDHTHFETKRDFFAWFHQADGWATMPFVDGARGAIRDLKAAGHSVRFVSKRPDEALPITVKRLEMFGCMVTFPEDKSQVQADIWLDDAPVSNKDVILRGDRYIIFDQPWNRAGGKQFDAHWTTNWKLERAYTWADFVEICGKA